MAALVIENEEAIRLAHEIAENTGQPVEAAVVMALRKAAATAEPAPRRLLSAEERKDLWESLQRLHRLPQLSSMTVEDLYDEQGLPR